MVGKAPIFEKIYRDYLAQVNMLDLQAAAKRTGAEWTGKSVIVPLVATPYRISKNGILDPFGKEPIHSVKVVLCQYLLLHPTSQPDDDTWVSYKDFRDAAPLATSFHVNSEMGIARNFGGRLMALEEACLGLGGYNHPCELNYDLHMKLDALPRVPILLLFNDADDEFPAQCLLLFERRAEQYLDMECLAILGWILTENLKAMSMG